MEHPHPENDFKIPELFDTYITNLLKLRIIEFPIYNQVPIIQNNIQTGVTQFSRVEITTFGYSFYRAITNY